MLLRGIKTKVPATKKWAIRRLLQTCWLAPFLIGWLLKPGVDNNLIMIRTVEAIVDEKGQVRLSEPIQLSRSQRALVTILDEEAAWAHAGIQLVPLNEEFQTIWINPDQVEDLRVVAEFIRVVQ